MSSEHIRSAKTAESKLYSFNQTLVSRRTIQLVLVKVDANPSAYRRCYTAERGGGSYVYLHNRDQPICLTISIIQTVVFS